MEVVAFLAERLGNGAGQEFGRAAPVHGTALRRLAVAVLGQPADDGHLTAERLQRLEDLRQLETRSLGRRRPALDDHAVRQIDDAEAADRTGRGLGQGRQSRDHAVEQRQGQARTETAQDGPARQVLLGNDHDSDLRF